MQSSLSRQCLAVLAVLVVTSLSACTQSQLGLGIDLNSGAVTPSFTGSSGNASISIGG